MKRRDDDIPRRDLAQTLKYAEFTPRPDDDDDSVRFKKLDVVMERVNKEIQSGKTDKKIGDIITIETLYFPANYDWKVEDETKVRKRDMIETAD